MVVTSSQVLIFICVLFFIAFNWIAIYLYKENYSYKKIPIDNPELTWQILSDIPRYKDWWSKFFTIDHIQNHVKVKEKRDGFILKLRVVNISKTISEENWIFLNITKNEKNTLLIRKETKTTSNLRNFVNKYYLNTLDIKSFIIDLKKEQESYEG